MEEPNAIKITLTRWKRKYVTMNDGGTTFEVIDLECPSQVAAGCNTKSNINLKGGITQTRLQTNGGGFNELGTGNPTEVELPKQEGAIGK